MGSGENSSEKIWERIERKTRSTASVIGRRFFRRGALLLGRAGGPRAAVVLLVLASGCAGYHLGPTNGQVAGEKSVEVVPFINQTLQPRLTDEVTQQMRKELQRDATYRLASHHDGDVLVNGTLTAYLRNEVTLAYNDILTVRDFRLSLTAHVTARERSTGKILLDQSVTGYTLIRVGSDLPSAERQAMPLLAQDLARNVTALLVEGKW